MPSNNNSTASTVNLDPHDSDHRHDGGTNNAEEDIDVFLRSSDAAHHYSSHPGGQPWPQQQMTTKTVPRAPPPLSFLSSNLCTTTIEEEDDIVNAVIEQEEWEERRRLYQQQQQQQQQSGRLSGDSLTQWMMEVPSSGVASACASASSAGEHFRQLQHNIARIDDGYDDGMMMMIDLSDATSNNRNSTSESISTKQNDDDYEIQQMIQLHVQNASNVAAANANVGRMVGTFYDGDSLTTNEDPEEDGAGEMKREGSITTSQEHQDQVQHLHGWRNSGKKKKKIQLPQLISSLKRPLALRSGDRTSTPHTHGSKSTSARFSSANGSGTVSPGGLGGSVLISHLSPERTRTLNMAAAAAAAAEADQQQQLQLQRGQSLFTSNTVETYYYTYEVEDPHKELSRPVPPFVVVHNAGHAIVKIKPYSAVAEEGGDDGVRNGSDADGRDCKKKRGSTDNHHAGRRSRRQMQRLKLNPARNQKNISPFQTGNDGIMAAGFDDDIVDDQFNDEDRPVDGKPSVDGNDGDFSSSSTTTSRFCCWRQWRPICIVLSIGLLILAIITVGAGLVRSKELEQQQEQDGEKLKPPTSSPIDDLTTSPEVPDTTDIIVLPPQTFQPVITGSDGDVLIPFEGTQAPVVNLDDEERTISPVSTGVLAPTFAPTGLPTFFTTVGPTGVEEVVPWNSYIIGLLSTESPDSFVFFDDASSPQYQALKWMSIDMAQKSDASYSSAKSLQRWAMSVLYFATGGPTQWTRDQDWISPTNECLWYSTSSTPLDLCDSSGNLVTLHLSGNNLSGSIPDEIQLLTHLSEAVLDNNSLTGALPRALFKLSFLETLSLAGNQISGSLPTEIGNLDRLAMLDASGNQITGSIPSQVASLINLEALSLECNSLSGSLPTDVGSLVELQSLHLGGNQMTGRVPDPMCDLGALSQGFARSMPPTIEVDCSVQCDCCNPCCTGGSCCST